MESRDSGDGWLTLPVSEFEHMVGEIRRLEIEIREVKIRAGHRYCEEMIWGLKERVKELEVELQGYRWGESNAMAEEHSLSELEADE